MKKKIIILIASFYAIMQLSAQGVSFTSGLSWEQVKAKAKSSNKYIYIDFYATWCQPCKAMDAQVYTDKSVGSFFNEKFISIKVQTDVTKEDNAEIKSWYKVAAELQSKYGINELPSSVFLSPEGEVVYKSTGYKEPADLIADGKNAMDPSKQYEALLRQYEQRKKDGPFVKALARQARKLGQENKAREIANEYIKGLTESQLQREDDAMFTAEFTVTSKNRGFELMRKDPARFDAYFKQPGIIKARLETILYFENIVPYQSSLNGKPDWQAMKTGLSKFGQLGDSVFIRNRVRLLFTSEVEPFLLTYPQWNEIENRVINRYTAYELEAILPSLASFYLEGIPAASTGTCLVESIKLLDKKMPEAISIQGLNATAFAVFQRCTDKKELETGLEWSRRVLAKDSNGGFIDTYASLLYKTGNKEEAIRMQERAVAKANFDAGIKDRLRAMKAGETIWPVEQASSQKQFGSWKLNTAQSDFGGLPLERAAPVAIRMIDNTSRVIVGREFAGGTISTDTLSTDGKIIHLKFDDAQVTRRLIPSIDGKILTVFSLYKVTPAGQDPYEYRRIETYFLIDDHTLLLHRFSYIDGNVEKVKAVYNRS